METSIRRLGTSAAVVSVCGSFDVLDAERLYALAVALGSDRVTLDFYRARPVHDSAIARLGHDLHDSAGRFALSGLSEHHRRLLRYMGYGEELAGHGIGR